VLFVFQCALPGEETDVNLDSNFTPIQTMMCGAKESSNQYQNKHKQ